LADRFISFTHTDEEISLILDKKSLSLFPKEKLQIVLDDSWIAFRRVYKNGFGETGVVCALAAPLTQIPILYLSSYKTSYFMVRKSELGVAVATLKRHGFEVFFSLPTVADIHFDLNDLKD